MLGNDIRNNIDSNIDGIFIYDEGKKLMLLFPDDSVLLTKLQKPYYQGYMIWKHIAIGIEVSYLFPGVLAYLNLGNDPSVGWLKADKKNTTFSKYDYCRDITSRRSVRTHHNARENFHSMLLKKNIIR